MALSNIMATIPFNEGLRDPQLHSVIALLFVMILVIHLADYIYARKEREPVPGKGVEPNPYMDIEPLEEFEWQTTEPLQIRPFKPKYNLTMALESCKLSELVVMDKNYSSRIQLRRRLLEEQGNNVLAANPRSTEACFELYEWLFSIYLPRRFPTMFYSELSSDEKPVLHKNLVTNELISARPSSAVAAMAELGRHFDNDFLILLPEASPPAPEQSRYILEAYINTFPAGFHTPSKLSQTLANIHAPVPGYAQKIEKSMDRFFATIPVGKVVKRANWSVSTDWELFKPSGNHFYAEDEKESQSRPDSAVDIGDDNISIENCCLRVERQTLHRLPKTKALVFAFKTYQYPLEQVKEEGNGKALAQAIDGLTTGNVPPIAFYKRAGMWGGPVQKFLLS